MAEQFILWRLQMGYTNNNLNSIVTYLVNSANYATPILIFLSILCFYVSILSFYGCKEKPLATGTAFTANSQSQLIVTKTTKNNIAYNNSVKQTQTTSTKNSDNFNFAKDLNRAPSMLSIDFPLDDIDTLIANKDSDTFFPSRISTEGVNLNEHMFQDPKVCGTCHSEIYKQWESSAMALSWEDPIYRAILDRASQATGGDIDNFCIGCHSPIGLTTGNAKVSTKDNAIASRGVDCETCHNISKIVGIGNGAFALTPNKFGRSLKFGPRSDASSPFHDTVYSDLHTKSEFCSSCHNVTHPFNKLAIERTFDEWRDSLYRGQGIECQDCHMTPGPGVNTNPGKSASMGKDREHIFSHQFAGANTTLLKHFGKNEAAKASAEMLKSAAIIEFLDLSTSVNAGKSEMIKLKVSNVGAGHKLPTGFPEGREVWVDFSVTDKNGKLIYRLGKIDHGHTEPGTKSFKATLGDKNGDVVDVNVWEADRILADTRILPNSYAILDYMIEIPEDAEGPLTYNAVLKYWPFPQSIVDTLLGKNKLIVDVVEMTNTSSQVDVIAPSYDLALKLQKVD